MSILDNIVEKRKQDISRLGYSFGITIPENRTRKIVPFIPDRGVILEVKRASPSKGDIAPDLNAPDQAKIYQAAGAQAISVLTEENYFKGSLKDLIAVAKAVDDVAVLRKDFLLDEEEIEIAWKCGADAVLLIARILDTDKIVSMAKKCQNLGISCLVELRLEEDLAKLEQICKEVDSQYVVCGVNSRDLATFRIDMLSPASMMNKIKTIAGENARVIFESGIRSPESAEFVSSMGFNGMLLGEEAARNPERASALVKGFMDSPVTENGKFWLSYAQTMDTKSAKVKICGLTTVEDAEYADKSNAFFTGYVFCKKSPRNCMLKDGFVGKNKVAVVTDLTSEESLTAINLVKGRKLDILQLHGFDRTQIDTFYKDEELKNIPHYFVVNLSSEKDLELIDYLRSKGNPRILIDSRSGDNKGGTGITINDALVDECAKRIPLWLAGGINDKNIKEILSKHDCELIDVSSGVEKKTGLKDYNKITTLFKMIAE